MTADEATRLLERHAAAWNAHDVDGLLALMTPDCVFDAAAGPSAHGQRHVGHEALQKAFRAILDAFPDATWNDAVHASAGDRGYSEWTFRGTARDGRVVEARGVDILGFRDGLICRKDTFRKNVPAR